MVDRDQFREFCQELGGRIHPDDPEVCYEPSRGPDENPHTIEISDAVVQARDLSVRYPGGGVFGDEVFLPADQRNEDTSGLSRGDKIGQASNDEGDSNYNAVYVGDDIVSTDSMETLEAFGVSTREFENLAEEYGFPYSVWSETGGAKSNMEVDVRRSR